MMGRLLTELSHPSGRLGREVEAGEHTQRRDIGQYRPVFLVSHECVHVQACVDLPSPLWVTLHHKALYGGGSHKRSGREQEVAKQDNGVVQMKLIRVSKNKRAHDTEYDREDEVRELIFRLPGTTALAYHHRNLVRECSANHEDEDCRDNAGEVAQSSELERNAVRTNMSVLLY